MKETQAILFDADGVVQRTPRIRNDLIWELVGKHRSLDELSDEIFHVVVPCARGEDDFGVRITEILHTWGSDATAKDFFELWVMVEPDHEVIEFISLLRRQYRVCLATNQEPYKAKHMAQSLGYDHLFDQSFYSCELGVAKPSEDFFGLILQELKLQPREILFIDDSESNVNAARNVGLNAEVFHVDQGLGKLTDLLMRYEVKM